MKTDRLGMSRVVTRATPKNTSSTPRPIHRRTLVVPSPGTKSPYTERAEPERAGHDAPERPRREERAAEEREDQPEDGEQDADERVPRRREDREDTDDHADGRHDDRERSVPADAIERLVRQTAPSRTAAIGGTIVARNPG